MSEPNEIVHQTLRLKILTALHEAGQGAPLEFTRLKRLTGATDGNLGRHISTLAEAGYITVEKDFHNNRPRTRATLTDAGKRAFEDHIAYLRSLIGGL